MPFIALKKTDSLTLTWQEPLCKNRTSIDHYKVTVSPDWNSDTKEASTIIIQPECLSNITTGRVFVTLKETTCGSSGYKFISCAPYNISLLPVFELASANEELSSWETSTQTLALENETSITSLVVTDTGGHWISISWPIPTCKIPVSEWKLQELSLGSVNLPPDCPTFVNSSHLSLNISEKITCKNSNLQQGLSLQPCSSYTFKMDVKYADLEEQAGSNNQVSTNTENECEFKSYINN